MSEPVRVALVGATGLIGRAVLDAGKGTPLLSLLALTRRDLARSYGAPVRVEVADATQWPDRLAEFRPDALVCALGTTWRKAGRDEAAFRAVDHGLVLSIADVARRAGAARAVIVSSVGADPKARSFYLRVKGEMERDVADLGFRRVDFLRPGLLRGERGGDRRLKERAAIALSPLADRLIPAALGRFRSIAAEEVARAALALCRSDGSGVHIHHNDDILRAVRGRKAD